MYHTTQVNIYITYTTAVLEIERSQNVSFFSSKMKKNPNLCLFKMLFIKVKFTTSFKDTIQRLTQ